MTKRINFLIGTLSSGGAERVVSNISLNLSDDIESNIILYGSNTKIDYPYKGDILILDKINHKNLLYKIYAFIYRVKQVKRIKIRSKESAFISFLEYPNLLNLLTKNYGKTIISVRNHMSSKHKSGIKSFFWKQTIKYLYNKADKIIAVSEEIKRDLIKKFGIEEEKICVIYNSYSLSHLQNLCKEKIEDKYKHIFEDPVIVTAGRLNKQKGQWHLIRAFKQVKQYIPNAKLVILGEGGLKEELIRLSEDLGILEDVHFLGFQTNPFKYISRSSIFVLSSFHEGFPNALAEAMACGLPIISSDCLSGPREIIAPNEINNESISYEIKLDRYGILTPVCDGVKRGPYQKLTREEQILANHILSLLQDSKKRNYFAKKSIERIKDFDIKNLIKEWEKLV